MLIERLNDNNFNTNLSIIDESKYSGVVIGYKKKCHKCQKIFNLLDKLKINYKKINIIKNEKFLQNFASQFNLTSIIIPIILYYSDNNLNLFVQRSKDLKKILDKKI